MTFAQELEKSVQTILAREIGQLAFNDDCNDIDAFFQLRLANAEDDFPGDGKDALYGVFC